jgi:hypothetical protein
MWRVILLFRASTIHMRRVDRGFPRAFRVDASDNVGSIV